MQASDFDHRCTEPTCCVYGQPTTTSCLCHKSREDMMLAALVAEKRAREEATEDTRSLCRFILSEWGPDGALKATTYSLEQREARSAKGGDANDSGPSRPIDATSPGVTAGASARWQSIKTTPRNRTRFLTQNSYYKIRIERAFMHTDHYDWLSYVDSNGSSHKGGIRASHWMPLPAVPVDGGEDA